MDTDRSKEEQKTILDAINRDLAARLVAIHPGSWTTRVALRFNDQWGIDVKHFRDGGADFYRVGHTWASGHRLVIDAKLDYNIIRYNESAPNATVRDDRGAKAVAQALVKRVLPDAIPMFDRERSVLAARTQRETATLTNAKRLGKAAGTEFRTSSYDKDQDPFLSVTDWNNIHGSISVGYDALKLNIRVDDMDLAAEILEVMRTHTLRQRTDVKA